jgi:hypothetical protein
MISEIYYSVDGKRMSSRQMFDYAVGRYGWKTLIITDTKARLVLWQHGHEVEFAND